MLAGYRAADAAEQAGEHCSRGLERAAVREEVSGAAKGPLEEAEERRASQREVVEPRTWS